ncbi:MAG: hypothetical protein IKK13_01890, partial [Clostridia bacterium]|nr:hypothetical protein [Clostridia bacterium]
NKIYVYSPDGNPADVFASIEIAQGYCLFVGNSTGELRNVKVQNLAIMYAGVHGFGKLGKSYNVEIEGCVLGFHGGRDLYTTGNSLGNAIEFWGVAKDIKVHDNYIFQCFDTGITHQGTVGGGKNTFDNIKYYNNLIEYCVWSIEAWQESGDTYGDVTIEGNICRYAGWGWGSLDRPDKNVYSDIQYTRAHTGNLIIKNNIFDRSRGGTFGMGKREYFDDKASLYQFTDNTIVIAKNRSLGSILGESCGYNGNYDAFLNKYFGTVSGNKIVTQ